MKRVASVIIENDKSEIVLQLRDDKPSIPFPNTWVLLGGEIEENETPEEGIKREIKEETGVDIKNLKLLKIYEFPDKKEWVYHVKMNLDLNAIKLNEGQKVKFFKKEEAKKLKFGFREKTYVEDFFK